MDCKITNRMLLDKWLVGKRQEKYTAVLNYMLELIGDIVDHDALETLVRRKCTQFKTDWERCHRKREYYLKQNANWLAKEVNYTQCLPENVAANADGLKRATIGPDQAIVIEYNTRMTAAADTANSLSPEQALAMIVELKLTTSQYKAIRNVSSQTYPRYNLVKQLKQLCYPGKITVNENYVDIEMQALIENTAQRLCKTLEDTIPSNDDTNKEVTLIFKWGCYAAEPKEYIGNNVKYHQCNLNLFCTSLMPIELFSTDGQKKVVIWKHQDPFTSRYCRPIRLLFTKVTEDIISQEVEYIQNCIIDLKPIVINTDKVNLTIKPKLLSGKIDGRLCKALDTYTPIQNCYLCGTPAKVLRKNQHDYDPDVITTQVDSNMKLVKRMLISSDPFVCSLRPGIKNMCKLGDEVNHSDSE